MSENPDDLLSPQEVASILKITTGALANKRVKGDGPAFVKGGRILYRRGDVVEYVRSLVRRSTSQQEAAA
ncbi:MULTISPECIES: helix-turn-helix transcriptional regulator [Bradyrhizobium]|uniref:helix-turn-helix transcriptional regulator n=1 Tax=Bradyrhizobium TaxID=374 RepID=UPI00209F57CE|nr:helix-turn-helix domain-containing protein [Bradyrhizobium elkanii]MCP1969919.1 hypothetical protein [Bradyrhizobium elkanii]MCS4108573.1 hypothetical protein [Bradyrhizobium elkanii]